MRRQGEWMEGVRETSVVLKHRLTSWSCAMGSPVVPHPSPTWPGAKVRSGSIPAPVRFRCGAEQRFPAGLLNPLPLPAQSQGRHCPGIPREMPLWQLQKMLSLSYRAPLRQIPGHWHSPAPGAKPPSTGWKLCSAALPMPGALLEVWPQPPTPQHTALQGSPGALQPPSLRSSN